MFWFGLIVGLLAWPTVRYILFDCSPEGDRQQARRDADYARRHRTPPRSLR